MNKPAAFFLLGVYILIQTASIGWYLYKPLAHAYYHQQSEEVSAAGKNNLLSITIDNKELGKIKNDDGEIVIDGVMYDIEKSVISGNKTKLLLERDNDETNWNINYSALTNQLQKKTGNECTGRGKIFFSLIPLFYQRGTARDFYIVKERPKIPGHNASVFYPWPIAEMITPPPRLCRSFK